MFRYFLTFFEWYFTTFLQISLISQQDARNMIWSILFDLSKPGISKIKGIAICDIVNYDKAMGAPIVILVNLSSVALKTSCVLDLQFANFVVHSNCTSPKVQTTRQHRIVGEYIISESNE